MEDKGHNPVGLGGTRRLGKARPPVRRPFVDAGDLGGALAKVRDCGAGWAVKCCIILMALTCVRGGEARGATWDEIDWGNAGWTIPANRTKSGVPHRVPLSKQAMEVLAYAHAKTGGQGLIFPSLRGGMVMASERLSRIFQSLEIPGVPHGLRSSFISWAVRRADIPVPVAEAVLAHVQPSDSFQRLQPWNYFEQRKNVMQEWATFLSETMGAVVPAAV